tara:strand:- start:32 stop:217 length:186 start_codon:yes stop_codon:yes gene_type:complete
MNPLDYKPREKPIKRKYAEDHVQHIIEELVDLEYDVVDTLARLTNRINYITEELDKLMKEQ